jgi:hypothetical protein
MSLKDVARTRLTRKDVDDSVPFMNVTLLLLTLVPHPDVFPPPGELEARLEANRRYQAYLLGELHARPRHKGFLTRALVDAQRREDLYCLVELARRPDGPYQRHERRVGPPVWVRIPWHEPPGYVDIDVNHVAYPVVRVDAAGRRGAWEELRRRLGRGFEGGRLPCHLPAWALPELE